MRCPSPLRLALLSALPWHPALLAATAAAQTQSPARGAARPLDGLRLDSARIDSVFAELDRRDSPGCVRGGRLACGRGYGMADLERGVPIGTRTVFDIGSTSKQFTTASIALLVAYDRLGLDDDVRKHVLELPDYSTTITIRQLIRHTRHPRMHRPPLAGRHALRGCHHR